ncbi:hypothetical protein EJO50_05120 [Iodobacter ciconiae]|uniref:Uncharacterized protein n=1 Tax=Iodobacter ciconiae TaxID=2496266 RepID=A0A3S8ZX91_9NEIS|nr:hypothetical protein EJO50_05120 [Iodobacter ciconiae]
MIIALLLGACTASPPATSISQAAICIKEGGEMKQGGIMGHLLCVKPYADAGKICQNKSDCQGKCLADLGTARSEDGQQTGLCQKDNMPFGCYAEVKSGNLGPGLCVD